MVLMKNYIYLENSNPFKFEIFAMIILLHAIPLFNQWLSVYDIIYSVIYLIVAQNIRYLEIDHFGTLGRIRS